MRRCRQIKSIWGSPLRRLEQVKRTRWIGFEKWYEERKAGDAHAYRLGGMDALMKRWEAEFYD